MALLFFAAAAIPWTASSKVVIDNLPQCRFQSQPGIDYLGKGVDLTNFLPRVGAVADMKHYVVDLTCEKDYVWRNPYNNQTFSVWDQVESILGDPSSAQDGVFFKFQNTFEFSEHFGAYVDSSALFGLFSASAEFGETFSMAVQTNSSMLYEYGKVNAFVAELSTGLRASEGFISAASEVPEFWWLPSSWPAVSSFISQFGTHFVYKAALGGEYRYSSICESVYVQAQGEAHAEGQAALDFLFLLHADGGASGEASAAEVGYQAACRRSVQCIGGDQAKCNMNSTSAWADFINSVDTNPGPGLTNAYYLLSADLLKAWHPVLHVVIRDMTIAFIAWSGLEKLIIFFEAARAVLSQVASLPDPLCWVSNITEIPGQYAPHNTHSGPCHEVGTCTCGTKPYTGSPDFSAGACSRMGGSGDPLPAVQAARRKAQALLDSTSPHLNEMTDTQANAGKSREVGSWLQKAAAWLDAFASTAEVAFSPPKVYTCEGSLDTVPGWCCDQCCWNAGDRCDGDHCSATCLKGASCSEQVILPSLLVAAATADSTTGFVNGGVELVV